MPCLALRGSTRGLAGVFCTPIPHSPFVCLTFIARRSLFRCADGTYVQRSTIATLRREHIGMRVRGRHRVRIRNRGL